MLTYHVVPDAAALVAMVRDSRGVARLTTVQGGTLTVRRSGRTLTITNAKGGRSLVAMADLRRSNGVVHVIGAC